MRLAKNINPDKTHQTSTLTKSGHSDGIPEGDFENFHCEPNISAVDKNHVSFPACLKLRTGCAYVITTISHELVHI